VAGTGKDPDTVDEVERDRAKRIVYGILYGMGARTLSEILNGTPTQRLPHYVHMWA
jgi:DNA polymerase theta